MNLEATEALLCPLCSPDHPTEYNQCKTCDIYYCPHLSCRCPPRTLAPFEVIQENLWEAETEVWQLNEVERSALLTEWQRGRRRMLSGRIEKLRNQLRMA